MTVGDRLGVRPVFTGDVRSNPISGSVGSGDPHRLQTPDDVVDGTVATCWEPFTTHSSDREC